MISLEIENKYIEKRRPLRPNVAVVETRDRITIETVPVWTENG